jgi:hypothetical protein
VRIGNDELGAVRQGRTLQVFEVADAHRRRGHLGQQFGAGGGHSSDDLGADAGEELAERQQQVGIGGNGRRAGSRS